MDRSQLNKILQARQHLDQLLDQEQEQEVESSTWRALAVAQDEMLKNLLESFRYKDEHVDTLLRLEEYKARVLRRYPGAAVTWDEVPEGPYAVITQNGKTLGNGHASIIDAWRDAASWLPMPR